MGRHSVEHPAARESGGARIPFSMVGAHELLGMPQTKPGPHFHGVDASVDRRHGGETSTIKGVEDPKGERDGKSSKDGKDGKDGKGGKPLNLLSLITEAQLDNDNFKMMKALRDNKPTEEQLRKGAEDAQRERNGKLGKSSIRLGVDDDYLHIHIKNADITLPYHSSTDAKFKLNTDDPKVRTDLLQRLGNGMRPEWNKELGKLSTQELAIFDAVGRSDGPALRSALMVYKDADDAEKHFDNIEKLAKAVGLSNWGTRTWSNDFNHLTINNGTILFSGKFPIKEN